MIKRLSFISVLVFLATVILPVLARPDSAQALSGSQFKAGKIISDSNFFNGNAMKAEQIQQFLQSKVPACDTNHAESSNPNDSGPPYTCLKSYRDDIAAKPAEAGLCGSLSAQSNRLASDIIYKVGKACGVSQKALLVLLQKEQSLVTDTWPWDIQYRSATGYGCPDGGNCASEYYGFFNQVYKAAWQFKRYAKFPDSYNHIANETNSVRYHPNAGCGSKSVFIYNQATAGLYNYTPYTPNKAALDNLYGTGNSCSSYGNRNFWRLYNDWFGNTLTEPLPIVTIIGDWSGPRGDEIGFKRGNQYYYDTDHDGIAEVNFGIGRATDKAIVGDWDGDGKDEIGLKRGDHYYLDNNNDGTADVSFGIGRATDKAIVGDWDGDGDDSIGLKRGNHYYLDNNNDGRADIHVGIGRTTDSVIVGDWDNDGKDEIGLKRGAYYYFDTNHNGTADISFGMGRSSDRAFVGDWDGDGDDSIGLKRGNHYYLDNNNDGRADIHVGIGRTTDGVIIGDWDSDGDDSIGLKRYNRYYYDNDNDGTADVSFILNYF